MFIVRTRELRATDMQRYKMRRCVMNRYFLKSTITVRLASEQKNDKPAVVTLKLLATL